MNFRVGQKVIRVGNASPGAVKIPAGYGHTYPRKGEIVTIKTINHWPLWTLLTFVEHDNSHLIQLFGSQFEPGFEAKAFRPLVERKTSIEIFTRMLNPSKERETVS